MGMRPGKPGCQAGPDMSELVPRRWAGEQVTDKSRRRRRRAHPAGAPVLRHRQNFHRPHL